MAKSPEEKKAAQARAHKKWRESEKGKLYKLRQKMKAAGIPVNKTDEQT